MNASASQTSASLLTERKPTDSDISVVFRGDGEPKTPRSFVRALAEIDEQGGIEADSYILGGVVEKLERKFADMLGKQAAAFMPTGTLANHLAIRRLCGTKPRAIVQEQSHLYHDTGDCVTQLSGINLVPMASNRPYFTLTEVEEAVAQSKSGRVDTPIGALMIESPVRRQAGQITPFDEMKAVTDFCRQQGIPTHLDGARLYMMCAATGIKPQEYASLFDTVYVSLYKYFSAPFGAILAGDSEVIGDIYHERRMFGGGLASAALPGALALRGIEGFEERFSQAMSKAAELFTELNNIEGMRVEAFEHGSNIFALRLDEAVNVNAFISSLKEDWIFVSADEPFHGNPLLTVNTTILRQPTEKIAAAFKKAMMASRNDSRAK